MPEAVKLPPSAKGAEPTWQLRIYGAYPITANETGEEPVLSLPDPGRKAVSIGVILHGKTLAFPLPQGIQAGQSTQKF